MLLPLVRNGRIVTELPRPKVIRDYVLEQLEKVQLEKCQGNACGAH